MRNKWLLISDLPTTDITIYTYNHRLWTEYISLFSKYLRENEKKRTNEKLKFLKCETVKINHTCQTLFFIIKEKVLEFQVHIMLND